MDDATKKGRIKIKIDSHKEKVNALYLVETIKNFQNTLFSVGDYLEGKLPRSSGTFSKKVRDSCELYIHDVKIGSLEVDLGLPPQYTALEDNRTFGEQSIYLTSNLISAIESDNYPDEVKKLIPEPVSRKRILENMKKVAPYTPDYWINFSVDDSHSKLNIESGERIKKIIPKIEIPDSKKVTGWLMELRVDGKRSFQIDTHEGLLKGIYTPDVEEFFKNNLGTLVELEGTLKKEKKTELLQITSESNINKIDKYPISSFKVDNKLMTIQETPIYLDVEFEDNYYILHETDFGFLSSSNSFKKCVDDVKSQLSALWEEYVKSPESTLTSDAKLFRKKLKGILV